MSRYAENTTVSTEKSRAEIESTLERFGASSFMYGWQNNQAIICFETHGRRIKFVLDLPDKKSRRFTHTPAGKSLRTPEKARAAWEQACREHWRALALVIKAKLAACEAGISAFEEEFMAHIVLPGGSTVGEFMKPQIEKAYTDGSMPKLLPMITE